MSELTFRRDDDRGEWIATFRNYYHAADIEKGAAVRRLGRFLKARYPEVEAEFRAVADDFFEKRPANKPDAG